MQRNKGIPGTYAANGSSAKVFPKAGATRRRTAARKVVALTIVFVVESKSGLIMINDFRWCFLVESGVYELQ